MLTDKKLKRKFNIHIRKYQKWCLNHGYNSTDEVVLLWYFNRKKKALKNKKDNQYYITHQGINYKVSLLITLFKKEVNK